MCVCVCVTGTEKGLKEMMRFGAFIIIGDSNMDASRCTCTMVFPLEKWKDVTM